MRFGVLGPLTAADARGPADLKGPRHRAVLARLLVARGRVVPLDLLIDDLWDDPPDGAPGAVQTFVAALRRALEPDRPPRTPPKLLVTSGRGYALHAEDVDAWRFESAVAGCGELLARHRPGEALSLVEDALTLWRGPAYAGFADQAWARGEISRLEEVRHLATERRAEALLALGRAADAVPDLRAHVTEHPLREDGWRLLALAFARSERQGDALEAVRRARRVLRDELGVDPGPGLKRAEADILAQTAVALPAGKRLVGRDAELTQLASAEFVLISGDPGTGKTALAEAFAARLAAQGWTVAWGANPEDEGLPPAWPWTRILDTLAAVVAPPSLDPPPGDPVAARFHRRRALGAYLAEVAAWTPLLLVLDDLQWAGPETLALLASVVPGPRLRIVAIHRATDVPVTLADFLGRVARAEPTRVYLGGLTSGETHELVRATIGDIDAATAEAIHRRSGGNPFFIRELARLHETEGGLESVPPGVRDVVRRRVTRLPDAARRILPPASVLGSEFDLGVLAAVCDEDVLEAVENAAAQGLLTELGPNRFGFAHALVRDTLYQDLSRSRQTRWHLAIGEALEASRPDDVDALAHHFLLAGSDRAYPYVRAAAENAERRVAPHEAARLWQAALDVHTGDVRERLDVIMGLVRALALTGGLERARAHRGEALDLAGSLGDPMLTARVIGAFDIPALWTAADDPALAARIVDAIGRVLPALPRGAERSRLLATLALELRNTGGPRAAEAAREAEEIARELGDPAVLAFAFNARFMQTFHRAGLAPERAGIGEELVRLAARHELVTFEVLGHLIVMQARCALADLAAADHHAAAADRLAETHQLPLAGVFTQWYRALRADIEGEPAEGGYRSAAARLAGTGMTGLDDGILAFTLFCHRLRHGRPSTVEDYGGYDPWCRPGESIPDSPRDLLYEARTCLHARVAIERGDRAAMARLYADLLPAEGELAGAGSGLLSLGPVAKYLGDLAAALGLPQAVEHYQVAATR